MTQKYVFIYYSWIYSVRLHVVIEALHIFYGQDREGKRKKIQV